MLWRQVSARDCTRCILDETTGAQNMDASGRESREERLLFYQTLPGGSLATHVDGLLSGEVCLSEDLNEKQNPSVMATNHCKQRGGLGLAMLASAVKNNLTD